MTQLREPTDVDNLGLEITTAPHENLGMAITEALQRAIQVQLEEEADLVSKSIPNSTGILT